MRKFLVLISFILAITSCYTSEDQKNLQRECNNLSKQKVVLNDQIKQLNISRTSLKKEINNLQTEKKAILSGKEPRYIVRFKIKQGTFTLDVFEHIKNEANSIEIEIPVNRDFYNRLSIGQDMTNSFKWGSLIFNGDFSTLHMKVTGKRIE